MATDLSCISGLQQECQDLWADLQRLQSELNSSRRCGKAVEVQKKSAVTGGEDVAIDVAKAKCKQLLAEIEVADRAQLNGLPKDPWIQSEILVQDLKQSVSKLQETRSFVRYQKQELQEELQREKTYEKELETVVQALENKITAVLQHDTEEEHVKTSLAKKTQNAEKYQTDLAKQTGAFVDKHFPLPSEEDFKLAKKKLQADKEMKLKDLLPLKDILTELLTKCVDSPNEPYITVDHRYWPPYLELLLRCDIVVRDPDDSRRIKMIPFHL